MDQVGWAALEHNYGSAADVPALLRGCADPDPGRSLDAVGDLDNLLYHQGGWICPAASAALPFLLELAADPRLAYFGSWRVFTEDAELRAAAAISAGGAGQLPPRRNAAPGNGRKEFA